MSIQAKLCTFLLVFMGMVSVVTAQQYWPMVNANPQRTSWASDEDQLHPPLENTGFLCNINHGYQTLSLLGNQLISSWQGEPNYFISLDTETGDSLWQFEIINSRGSNSFCAAQNDSLAFLGGQYGEGLYAVDKSTGLLKWLKPINISMFTRHPILDDDRLYIVGDSLYCLDINDGSVIWSYYYTRQTSPAIDENFCYLCTDDKIIKFEKYTGVQIWEKSFTDVDKRGIVIDDSNIYTADQDSVIAVDKTSGELVWYYDTNGCSFTASYQGFIAITDELLCFTVWEDADTLGNIYTLGKSDGSYKWHHTFEEGKGASTPTIANGVVYITLYANTDLYGFDINTGEMLLNETGYYRYQPIVANNKLYVLGTYISVFENKDITAVSENPKAPATFKLLQNYPNPFNPITRIEFELLEKSHTEINIFNVSGQHVTTLTNETLAPGAYVQEWNAKDCSSGIYFCELITNSTKETNKTYQVIKMLLQK